MKVVRWSLGLWLAGLMVMNAAAVRAEVLALEAAVQEALASNPSLSVIEARAQALAQIPDQAETLPDPVLSINLANLPLDSFSFTQEGMTQLQVGVVQALPYPGKLALQSAVADHQARAARFDLEQRRLQLVRDVKTVWWNLYYLDRALDVVARNQVLLGQFVNVAETRYTVGRGLQQDILLAQLELSRLDDSKIKLEQMRDLQVTRLNVLMDKPVTQTFELPKRVTEELPALQSIEELLQRALASHPVLAAQSERLAAARSQIDLAEKSYSPDFKVGAVYGLRSGENPDGSRRADLGSIMFSMNLPLYTGTKQDRNVDQRNAEWMSQKYRLHDQRNELSSKIRQAVIDYRRAGEQVELFKTEIIPQARQTVDAMMAGYQVGKVDFLNLVRSQTTLYNYETQYWNAFSAANQALARLVAAVGEENVYE